MIGGIVPQVECAEARAESAEAYVEFVRDAIIEVRHVRLEAVASETDLHVRREVIAEVGGELGRELDGRAVERRRLRAPQVFRCERVVGLRARGGRVIN